MREYIKKKRIDSLDLKYIVPKRLAIHRHKEGSKIKESPKTKESPRTKEPLKLPPISPISKQSVKTRPAKIEGILTRSPSSEVKAHSKQGRKEGSR